MRQLAPGQTIGRYRLVRRLGAGAMGEVYLADDPQIERQLAIKTMLVSEREGPDSDNLKRRLLREAKAAGRLVHPHVVTLFDAGEDEGLLYLAFEFVAGSDLLRRAQAEPPLTVGEILRIVREAAEGLEHAHQMGIVHRDVKPSNILLDARGKVKVADFGIAKLAGQATELTMEGSVVGSPQYLSPEQVRGEELDGASDVFSLGVVLYELLTRSRPFAGETLTTIVYQILHKDPPPLDHIWPACPPQLANVVARMLAKDRRARMTTAAEVVASLAELERTLPSSFLGALPLAGDEELGATMMMRETGATRVRPVQPMALAGAAPPPPPPVGTAATLRLPGPSPASGGPPTPPPLPPPLPVGGPATSGSAGMTPPPPMATAPRAGGRLPLVVVGVGLVLAVGVAGGLWWVWRGKSDGASTVTASHQGSDQREPMAPAPAQAETAPAKPSSASGQAPATGAPAAATAPAPAPPVAAERPPVAAEASPPAATTRPSPSPSPSSSSSPSTAPSRQSRVEPPAERAVDRPAPGPTTPSRPAPREPVAAATPAPAASAPSADAAPEVAPVAPRPSPASPPPSPPPVVEEETIAFDRELTTGLGVVFDIVPEDTFVLVRRVGERRAINIGKARDWNGKEQDDLPARHYGFADPGDYVVTLRHERYGDYVMLVHVEQGGPGQTPIKLRMGSGK